MVDTIGEDTEIIEPEVEKGWWGWFKIIAASIFALYHLLYTSDLLTLYTPIVIPPAMHLGVHLACILFFTFLLVRAKKGVKMDKPPIYDVVLAFVALAIPLYYAFLFEEILQKTSEGILLYYVFGWVLSFLLLEGARRLLGIPFTCVIAFFLFYPLFSAYMPGVLYHPGHSWVRVGELLFISPSCIMGFILNISATIIVVFLLFSQLLLHSGAGRFFINLAYYSAFGAVRGGPAKMAVIASGFFGTLSGSPAGNVAATGTFTIPLMKKTGYQPHYAGAVEAVASLGGMLMPPVMGALIFILANFIQMPYIEVCKRAAIPAVLYYLALFIMVDQEAVRLGLRGLARETLPSLWNTLKRGWWYLVPLIVLVYLLAGFHYTPQKSALWALVSLLVLAMFRKETRLGPMKLGLASKQTLEAMLMVGVAMACAGIIIGSVSLTGVAVNIASGLVEISGGNLGILLVLTAVVSFIMGLGIGATGCYVFLAVMVVPALVMTGVPAFAAHLFVFYWSLVSFITPPVAVLAFIAAGFAECPPFKVGLQATRLGLLAYVLPFAFVIKPALVFFGTPIEIVVAVVCVVIGTAGLSFGVGGHFIGKINWPQRVLFLAGSMLLIFSHSTMLIGSGAVVLGVAIFCQWLKMRLAPS